MESSNDKSLKEEILDLLGFYFGSYTKGLYQEFYKDKSPEKILASARELLSEILGQRKADILLEPISKKFKVKLR